MTVHAVTARQGGGLLARSASRRRFAQAIPRIARTAASRAATSRLALSLLGRTSPLPVAALIGAWMWYNRKVEPDGFPGFDSIDPGWRTPLVTGVALGDYAPNPFDHGSFDNPPESLLDINTAEIPFGIIYWGDFGAEPYPDALPGINWPVIPQALPVRHSGTSSRVRLGGRIKYNLLPNLVIGVNDLIIDDGLDDNVVITIPIPIPGISVAGQGVGAARQAEVKISKNAPRKKTLLERKARPRNLFIWLVLKKIANAGGEAKEWIDILAEATDFKGWRARGFQRVPLTDRALDTTRPWQFRGVGSVVPTGIINRRKQPSLADRVRPPSSITDGGHETQLKAWYLFKANGLDSMDWELLFQLAIENEVEDFAFGVAGRMSKFSAQNLGLTLGPQAGPLI